MMINAREYRARYDEYLESDHWKDLRLRCFSRDGNKCRSCRSIKLLNCHHLIYRNLTDCTVEDVMTLCEICHGKIHKHMKSERISSGTLNAGCVLEILAPVVLAPVKSRQEIQRWVWEEADVFAGRLTSLLLLSHCCNDAGCFQIPMKKFCALTRMSKEERGARKNLNRLQKEGLIDYRINPGSGILSGKITPRFKVVPVNFRTAA